MKKLAFLVVFLMVWPLSCGGQDTLGSVKELRTDCFSPAAISEREQSNLPVADDASGEIKSLQAVFASEVSSMAMTDQVYLDKVIGYAKDKLGQSARNQDSQYFIFVDRNENRQNIMIGFYNAANGNISVIGWDKVSTGNPNRTKHYITPTGIFENNVKHMSYRAQGTRNKKGWMGLGVKGSRVWDFGWQASVKKGYPFNIRMMMHATDPKFGEPRLGKRDSKGCIRVSAKMNRFLDFRGIIDRDYEEHPKQGKRVLLKDRQTVSFPGWYLIIGDFE